MEFILYSEFEKIVKSLYIKKADYLLKDLLLSLKDKSYFINFIKDNKKESLRLLLKKIKIKICNDNEILFYQNDKVDYFYFILKGRVDICINKKIYKKNNLKQDDKNMELDNIDDNCINIINQKGNTFKTIKVNTLREGQTFGDYSIVLAQNRTATAISNNIDYRYFNPNHQFIFFDNNNIFLKSYSFKGYEDKVILGYIKKDDYINIIKEIEDLKNISKTNTLKSSLKIPNNYSFFKHITYLFNEETYKKFSYIFYKNTIINNIYIITSGSANYNDKIKIKKDKYIKYNVISLNIGNILGLSEIINNSKYYYFDCKCEVNGATVFKINIKNFLKIIKSYPEFFTHIKEKYINFDNYFNKIPDIKSFYLSNIEKKIIKNNENEDHNIFKIYQTNTILLKLKKEKYIKKKHILKTNFSLNTSIIKNTNINKSKNKQNKINNISNSISLSKFILNKLKKNKSNDNLKNIYFESLKSEQPINKFLFNSNINNYSKINKYKKNINRITNFSLNLRNK